MICPILAGIPSNQVAHRMTMVIMDAFEVIHINQQTGMLGTVELARTVRAVGHRRIDGCGNTSKSIHDISSTNASAAPPIVFSRRRLSIWSCMAVCSAS